MSKKFRELKEKPLTSPHNWSLVLYYGNLHYHAFVHEEALKIQTQRCELPDDDVHMHSFSVVADVVSSELNASEGIDTGRSNRTNPATTLGDEA